MGEQILPSSSVLSAMRSLGVVIPIQQQFVVDGSENFRVRIACSLAGVTVTLSARLLIADGSIQPLSFTFTPTSDRSINTFDVPIGQGALLNAVMFASAGNPIRGQCFAQLNLIQGLGASALPLGTLLQDYITSFQSLAWPGSPIAKSVDGAGWQHVVTVPNPAPGQNAELDVPTGVRWQIRSMFGRLTTSAAVGNRYPNLGVVASGVAIAIIPMAAVPGPTAVTEMTWSQQSAFTAWSDGSASPTFTVASSGFPGGFALEPGTRIIVAVRDMDAADQLDVIAAQVEEWLELN